MSRIERLLAAIRALGPVPSADEDDGLRVLPPATDAELDALCERCNGALPAELKVLLNATAGFEHTALGWRPEPEPMGNPELGRLLRASHSGNGDGFAIEPHGEVCRVWWVGHDPWFLVYWAPSIEAFLDLWLARACALRGDSPRFDRVWSPLEESSAAAPIVNVDLQKFRDELPRGSIVHDLRAARPGTEIPFERLQLLVRGGSLRRRDLLFGFSPPPRPVAVEPLPIAAYAHEDLSEADRGVLRSLPQGSLVVHERDVPPGGRLDLSAHAGQDAAWRPPFHVLYPKRPWWRLW